MITVVAAITAACGDSQSSMNPVAPSAVVVDAQSVEAGDPGAVSGVARDKPKDKPKNGNGNGNQPTVPTAPAVPGNTTPPPTTTTPPPTTTTPPVPSTKKVELEGLITAKDSNTITVNGQTATVPLSCPIRHGSKRYTFADLRVGDRVHVKATRTTVAGPAASSVTTLEANEVKLQNRG